LSWTFPWDPTEAIVQQRLETGNWKLEKSQFTAETNDALTTKPDGLSRAA
jgi:hypothetical protein